MARSLCFFWEQIGKPPALRRKETSTSNQVKRLDGEEITSQNKNRQKQAEA